MASKTLEEFRAACIAEMPSCEQQFRSPGFDAAFLSDPGLARRDYERFRDKWWITFETNLARGRASLS